MRRLFVDTSAWLALINAGERHHTRAVEFQRGLPGGVRRITTWGIVGETYTWLRYRIGYHAAQQWLHEEAELEERGVLEVVYPTAQTEAGTRRTVSRFADQDLSYVDAFSLYIVQTRRDFDAIFAFDHHLSLSGVPLVPGDIG